MWDVRGWNRLTLHDDPPLVAAREEFLVWLEEVPEPFRTTWENRLRSDLDSAHFSVRLELFLHHYFKKNRWLIEIEPEVPKSGNKPDFRLSRGNDQVVVEAKAVLDQETITRETQRLRRLADDLEGKLSGDVIIEPLSPLPPNAPARRIRHKIESRIEEHVRSGARNVLEFEISDVHEKTKYQLAIIFIPRQVKEGELHGVGGTISEAHWLNLKQQIRKELEKKAGKYGPLNMPFVIAVYGAGEFPVNAIDECDALFGDRKWNIPETVDGVVTETRKRNGLFTAMRDGSAHQERVSAVLFYRFKWLDDGHLHQSHMYHNPFARLPLDPALLPDMPQLVFEDAVPPKWVNGEPDQPW